jgi:hypothetical protein
VFGQRSRSNAREGVGCCFDVANSSRWSQKCPWLPSVQLRVGLLPCGASLLALASSFLEVCLMSGCIGIMDDALVAVGVGPLVFLYQRRQKQNLIRKLEVIRMMNHHVRNSLQLICHATSVLQQEDVTRKVRGAVERIEWALREVLPRPKRRG